MKKGFETLEALLNGEVSGQGGSTGPKMSKAAVLNKAKVSCEILSRDFTLWLGSYREDYDWAKAIENWNWLDEKRNWQSAGATQSSPGTTSSQWCVIKPQPLKWLILQGLPLAKPTNNKVMAKFAEYVSDQTRQNYKFYVFSRIMKRLFESYTNVVSTTDPRQLRSSTNQWVDVQCR